MCLFLFINVLSRHNREFRNSKFKLNVIYWVKISLQFVVNPKYLTRCEIGICVPYDDSGARCKSEVNL